MLGIGLSVPEQAVLRPGFTPADLGASLYDSWDAERADLISLSGSAVTAWASTKNGYSAAQATGAARPVYSATSSNGRPGITFDGSDDELTYAGVGVFPTGASACEIWALVDQTALAADATTRSVFRYGDGVNASRDVRRVVDTGVNRFATATGTGAANAAAINTSAALSGRHVLRAQFGATETIASLNGSDSGPVAAVPATATVRTRLGASSATAAGQFWMGVVSFIAVTAPLTTPQAAQMLAYLKARGGIA